MTFDEILQKRGGENCPFWRDRESKAKLLAGLAQDAVKEAILEHGASPRNLRVEATYYDSRREPQCCYGKVTVIDDTPQTTLREAVDDGE
ncbi:uncharacterized protein NP_7066A (plasmid) [Natronomonas pharaonis DSM 2160]|uniref:Uncharacterized protein n=1 Tax=Natronomonas pharaonis (strain ATCC 35678 / DSM 2160 / CIP 103997 / JCM 8858 / NBRC 14720 / NCIMB 2260 / Gabara) TaxID=348780 RepID=Q3ILS2_NATPD|nr:hypothetical protein [Natronomonas pharaonis]CAI49712.1 uncharacterized protein NP_3242A [Natronomonas pharaonis DSM 2160]CAI50949.1 uncharacterized protein NP_7066A [Natronomonas pharaonis DSM 2160]